MTYTIAAIDWEAGLTGAASASAFPFIGSFVLHVENDIALAIQGLAGDVGHQYGKKGIELLKDASPESVSTALLASHQDKEGLQMAMIKRTQHKTIEHVHTTGKRCLPYAASLAGADYVVAGNSISQACLEAIAGTFEASRSLQLHDRLAQAIAAGSEAGGDVRSERAAAIKVVSRDITYGAGGVLAIERGNEKRGGAIKSLLADLEDYKLYLCTPDPADRITIDQTLLHELQQRLQAVNFYHGKIGGTYQTFKSTLYQYFRHLDLNKRWYEDAIIDKMALEHVCEVTRK